MLSMPQDGAAGCAGALAALAAGEAEGVLPAVGVEAAPWLEGEAPAGGCVVVDVAVEIDVVADEAVVELPLLEVLPLDDDGTGVLIVVVVVVTGGVLAVGLAADD